ncbi:glycoside hydrolase family 76 protein [Novosphingobium fuchskuhlense]|uniref:glycoside hydrolase family 76 protein n=1 Tax=Novosphingobium fuchskuhlense TaxID=1117702 RepID=UPI001F0ADE72|nr:glycoside hydrolase family 76 protein [Novosphingobium fuchskuhlense]
MAGLLFVFGSAAARAEMPLETPDWQARAGAVATYLDQTWGKPDGWKASENWQRFPIIDVLIDYQRRSGDARWHAKIAAAVRNRQGLVLNDDDLWAVITHINAWEIDHDPELLAWAAATYARIVAAHWDDHCGGGLWWDPQHSYKNAITNELLLQASTKLYRATGQAVYRDWAVRTWSWFAGSGMIGADGLVNDGLDAQCRNNGAPRWTYNQGVLLGGLNDLAAITGDGQYRTAAVRTALAATRRLVTQTGLLTEPSDALGRDGPMFKGVFALHLGHLIAGMPEGPDRAELQAWAQRNGEVVWGLSACGTGPIDGVWTGGSGQVGAAAQASGLAILLAGAP